MSSFTPFPSSSTRDQEENEFWLERELSLIQNALEDRGEMKRSELGDLLGCKYWGPRRFANALKAGAEQGRFRRVSRGRYGPSR
jgi:hypothetical protein